MADSVASTSSQPQSSSQDNATTSQAGNVASPPNPDKQTKKNVTTGNKANAKHGGRREETPDVRASKALSYILRHGAAKEGLKLRPDGFVKVDDLVRHRKHFV
jgi:2'-phosphotransferase